jgi:hypothetical protein
MKTIKDYLLAQGMVRFFLRQFYKLAYYEGRYHDAVYGRFRVKYNDGRISQKMCYSNAKDYAEIFGGTVIDDF